MSKKTNDAESGNWLEAMLELGSKLGPGIHHITIEHDDDCPMLADKGECTCSPFVRPGMPDSMKDDPKH